MKTKEIIVGAVLIIFLTVPLASDAGFFGGLLGGLLGNIGNQIIGGAVNGVISGITTPEVGEIVPSSLGGADWEGTGSMTWPEFPTSGGTGGWTETPSISDISGIMNRTITGGVPGMDQVPNVLRGTLESGIREGIGMALNGVTGADSFPTDLWTATQGVAEDNLPSTVSGLIQRATALDSTAATQIQLGQTPRVGEILRGISSGQEQTGTAIIVNPIPSKSFEELIGVIIVFLRNLALVVTPLIFVMAGYQFVTSQGDPKKIITAQQMMLWAAVGLGLILMAEGIIELLETMVKG